MKRPVPFHRFALFCVLFSSFIWGCGHEEEQTDPEAIFTVKNGVIGIDTTSPMMKYLETAPVEKSKTGVQDLRVVGQIFALANYSDQLVGTKVSWVELDPELSHSLGFYFGDRTKAVVGEAFGFVTLPNEYMNQLKPYETVSISRYGLLASRTMAQVISILPTKIHGVEVAGGSLQVVFKIVNGQDWYPGANCVVSFPMLGAKPLLLPSTALMHEGRQEYMLQVIGKGFYLPKPVYVLDTLGDSVLVIGKLKPGDTIVSRGSILLKPILHRLLRTQISVNDMGDKENQE